MNQIIIKLWSIALILNFASIAYSSIPSYVSQPLLIEGLKANDFNQVQQAVEYGALSEALNKNQQTALHLAGFYNVSPAILQYLIDQQIDINALDSLKRTVLHEVARHDNPAAIEILLQNNANVNARDSKNNSPLHLVKSGKIAQLLIDAQADINAQNIDGETPLMYAVRNGYKTVVETLLQNNANLYLKNRYNQTVFDLINNPILLCQYRQSDINPQDCSDIVDIFYNHMYKTSPFLHPVQQMNRIARRKDEPSVYQYFKYGLKSKNF